jgi:outer membrane protein assembly factor BamB
MSLNVARTSFLCSVLLPWAAAPLAAENWPQWRGPNGDGTSPEQGLPLEWSREKNVLWRFELPGPAGATPVVWEETIFLTTADGDAIFLISLTTGGKERWRRQLAAGNKVVRDGEGNSASPSPLTDGKHVWAMAGTGDLACFDFGGTEVWRRDLQKDYVPYDYWFGMASTPLLHGGTLYCMCIQMQDSYVAAFDKLSGKELWQRTRHTDAEHEAKHSYASPILYRDRERTLLLVHGGDYLTAHRLEDGAEVWRCGGLNPKATYNRTLRFIPSPAAAPGLVVAPSGKDGPVLAVRPEGAGDVSKTHVTWSFPRTPDVCTPLVHDGLVYLLRPNGVLIVLDAETGKACYEERVHSAQHRASPVAADGKVYCASKDGTVTVVKPGRKFEVLARSSVGEPIASTPVAAGGVLYLRSYAALYAIRASVREGADRAIAR